MRSIILIGAVILNPQLFFAQPANLIIGSSSYFCEGANAYVHLPGDIRCDGVINMAASSVWNFEGSSSQQRITCASGTGCTDIYNTNNYLVRLGSVQQYNSNGIAVEINTKVKGVHFFNSGATEIKEGNYWLTQTSVTPFSLNDNTSKFFVTTGHGLLKQSGVTTGRLFPVGSSATSNNYTPITITYSGTADDFGVRVFDNIYFNYDASNGDPSGSAFNYRFVKKTWIIKKTTRVQGDAFTVTPQWNLINEDAAFTPHRPSDISIARNINGSWWMETTQGPATPPTGAGPFTYTGVVTYNQTSEYFPVSVTALNVVLANNEINASGFLKNNNAFLNWTAIAEQGIKYYEIQRSTDACNFETVATTNAKQNNGADALYQYTDTISALTANVLYYKIKQTSLDNSFRYSNIVIIKKNATVAEVAVFPNPVQSSLSVFFANTSGEHTIKLINASGITVSEFKKDVLPGRSFSIPFGYLPKGIYFLKIMNKNAATAQVFKVVHN